MNGSPSESIPLTACCSLPVPCPLFVHYCCLAGCTHTQPQRNKTTPNENNTTPNENNDTPTTAAASRSSQKDNRTDQTTGLAPMSVVVASVKRIPGQQKNRISNRKTENYLLLLRSLGNVATEPKTKKRTRFCSHRDTTQRGHFVRMTESAQNKRAPLWAPCVCVCVCVSATFLLQLHLCGVSALSVSRHLTQPESSPTATEETTTILFILFHKYLSRSRFQMYNGTRFIESPPNRFDLPRVHLVFLTFSLESAHKGPSPFNSLHCIRYTLANR